jgi:glycosyltransferase involved in cell wall biosynthesis
VAQALAYVTRPSAPPREAQAPAPATRLLSIAPGHLVWDERVLRSLDAARRVHRCVLALDRDLNAAVPDEEVQRVRDRLGGEVEMVLLPQWPRARGLARLTRHLYAHRIAAQARALQPDVVHIHESGILGLMVAARVRRALPDARIIFDYHDWIPDEVAGSVRHVGALYGPAMAAWMPRLRRMARAVDVAVCISPGQAEWTRDELGIARTVVVQNVRDTPSAASFGRRDFRPQLVWAGHVMRIRRLELVVDVLARLREEGVDAELSIFGDLTEPDYADDLRAYARERGVEERVVFYGRFQGDRELLRHVGPGALGLTLAMEEKLPTGINRIASANKFFSYMAMGLPMLLEAQYENMAQIAAAAGAGEAFTGVEGCAAEARRIWACPQTWERMSQGALQVARSMNSQAYAPVLEALYRDPAGL